MARLPDNVTTGALLWQLATRWRAAVDRELAPLGLTHAQYMLLASLYGLTRTGARPSQRELADFAELDPIYVSKLSRTLERSGLLVRAGHPSDTRAVQLSLTTEGADLVERALATVRRLQDDLLAPIGGTAGPRNRGLVRILRALLNETPPNEKGSDTMSAAPILTGQDVAEAQGALQALLERTLATAGYTRHQFLALRVLASRGPIEPPARLHDFLTGQTQLGLDASAVAGLLGGLEADGLVTGTARDGAGPARLTDAGTALHTRLSGAIAPVTARVYDGVDPADLATAHEVLRRVTQTAEQLRGEI